MTRRQTTPVAISIHDLLEDHARRTPNALAILAPGRIPLTYGRLHKHVADTVQTLSALGMGRTDRVALILPNGPEMAVAVLAVAAGATCLPLNPSYRPREFDAYFLELRATALIMQANMDSPAREVARARGIDIVELSPAFKAEAGLFSLAGHTPRCPRHGGFAQPHDVAFVLPTSGTTSRPKIVPLTHVNVCTSAANTRLTLDLVPGDRALNVLPLFHAHGLIAALLASLAAGASIVCTPGFYAPQFFPWLDAFRPTWYTAVPTIHQAILARAVRQREGVARCVLRFIRSASAPLPPKVLAGLEQVFQVPVIETYGMTESASQIASNPLPPNVRKIGSVGLAAGPEVAIMDERGTMLPVGITGEIVLRGPTIMQGYEDNAVANQSAFTQGWFRTGDQGFCDAEGYVFITGRLKEVINRGGEKIAPQEVDQVLMEHAAVAQAVTFAVPEIRLGEEVAAAVVLHPKATATAQAIRQFAAARLAAFKVPQHILLVHDIPKGPTGKVQRLGLAAQLGLTAPDWQQSALPPGYAAPRTPLEKTLTEIWAQVLEVERVGIDDDFFQLGGDSILATQLLSRIRDAMHVEVSFLSFFAVPTVAGLARYLETANQDGQGCPRPPLCAAPRHDCFPLSYAQQRLWFLDQLGLSSHAYHVLEVVRLHGTLHRSALQHTLQEIVRRHDMLRTTFSHRNGQPYQVIGMATPLSLPMVDLQNVPAGAQEMHVHRLARAEVQRPFTLEQGPLLRALLLCLAAEEHVLILTMHHIVSDAWSQGVFWREAAVLYEAFVAGRPAPLPALPLQYADFAYWQVQRLPEAWLDPSLAYWTQQLANLSPLQIPTDRPRPAVWTFRGARYPLVLSPAMTQALNALSQRYGVTLFMTLLAAFQALLHRYTGQEDIPVGTLMANRYHIETEGLIGFFVNTVVLRTDVSGDPSVRELLERVRTVTLGAYSHQEIPFEKLLERLRLPRQLSHNPLLHVMCVLHNTPTTMPTLRDLSLSPIDVDPETAKFDVTLELWEKSEGLLGWFEYSTDLFDTSTIARMGSHFHTVLQGMVTDPGKRLSVLPLLNVEERQWLLGGWNRPAGGQSERLCIHHLFEAQVSRTPDAVAIVCAGKHLTYRELNRRANQVAHYLRRQGVHPEVIVGLCMERSLDLVVGFLGILKAGGVYLPLDPTYPSERLTFMLADAQASVLLTQQRLAATLTAHEAEVVCVDTAWPAIAQHSEQNPLSKTSADNLAYLLYTSGSTGMPKGVLGVHRATLNALTWMWQTYPFANQEVCCQKTSISFGDSLQELLGPLLQGVRTILIPDEIVKDPPQLVQTLATHRVTRMILVPSLLRVILDTAADLQRRLPVLTLWISSGEMLPQDLWLRFQECLPHSRLVNLYGASEMSDTVTWYDVDRRWPELASLPIGRPIANMQTYLLDRHLQLVPVGIPGEIHVGGAGLARGYLHRPALSAEQFIPHPFSHAPGARLYKTGDLARYLLDGNLEYLGRLDQQVKIRGFRIELGEIETALEQHPAVHQAVVLARETTPGEPRLVAYLITGQVPPPTPGGLRRFLKARLPDYMVPSAWVLMDTLPLTPSGKVDRHRLPAPKQVRPELEEAFVAPRNPTEELLAGIWMTVLGVEQVGVHDDFFVLGGHSLLATQVRSRLRNALHIEVPLRTLFDTPTVAGLALYIETARQQGQHVSVPPIMPVPRQKWMPISVSQEPLWVLDQLLPGKAFFTIPCVMRLTGPLDVVVLERSINAIIQRHEALRTTFTTVRGQPVQVISTARRLPLNVEDLRALPESEREAAVQRQAREEAQHPFNLRHGPLLRVRLLQVAEQEHSLLLTLHHMICDGWSLRVLVHELTSVYEALATGRSHPLPALRIQYADFAHWQRKWQKHEAMSAQLAYWKRQLSAPLPVLKLATQRPRTSDLSFHTACQSLVLPPPFVAALTRVGQREGSTLFMTLLAAFNILLYGYTGQKDLVVATLLANRNRQETEGLIGFLINTVMLRTRLVGNPSWREVLHRVRETTLAAYAHQDLPFEALMRTLERERGLRRRFLCQVMFILQPAMPKPVSLSGLTLQLEKADESTEAEMTATTFDMILIFRDRPQGLVGSCLYKTHLFEAATITRMLADFQRVLERLISQPEQLLSTFHVRGRRRS